MRMLDFSVDKQIISRSATCDFTGLVAGTSGYLHARFYFSREWSGFLKIAKFDGPECTKHVPLIGNSCSIPPEVLTGGSFKVSVIGKRGKDYLTTSSATVIQRRR